MGAGKIIATASTKEKLELAKRNGATHVVNYGEEDWVEVVKGLTREEGGVRAVFDGVGERTFAGGLEVLGRKGTMVSFGNASGAVEPLRIARLSGKCLKVVRPQLYGYIAEREEFVGYMEELMGLLVEKKVEVKVHKVYDLKEARQAHIVSSVEEERGRGVLTVGRILRGEGQRGSCFTRLSKADGICFILMRFLEGSLGYGKLCEVMRLHREILLDS